MMTRIQSEVCALGVPAMLERIRMFHLAMKDAGGAEPGEVAITFFAQVQSGDKMALINASRRSGLTGSQLAKAFFASRSWSEMPFEAQKGELLHAIGVWRMKCEG